MNMLIRVRVRHLGVRARVISFPDPFWTKPKARSGQIRFALRHHLSGMWQGRQLRMPNINSEKKADFVAYNKLTTGLRHDLEIFTRISKLRCFHETKQTQNEVERFFLQLGRICFRILLRQSENFIAFCKVLSQFAFRNMIVPFYTLSSARALKLPSISQASFLT